MTNVYSKKKKKCANGKGNSKADSVCVRAFSRLCFTFVQLFTVFFFFFRTTMSISECERRQTCTTSKLLPLPHLMMSRFSLLSSTRPNCKGKKEKKKNTRDPLCIQKKKRPD